MNERDKQEQIALLREELITRAGGFLRNIIREPGRTCSVCCTPVDGYHRCVRCNEHWHQYGSQLADLVVPLSYAVMGKQSGHVMRHYKDDRNPMVRVDFSKTVALTLGYGLLRHERCIESQLTMPIDVRVMVPSLSGRPGVHPFQLITDGMKATSEKCRLVVMPGTRSARRVGDSQFGLKPINSVLNAHVLILDDTWTTGSSVQSAAFTLRSAGARRISAITVSRWLEPSWPPTGAFVPSRLNVDYDPDRCPATGDRCP